MPITTVTATTITARPRGRLYLATAAVAAVAALGLAGCTPGSSAAAPHPTGPVQTDMAKLGKITLTEWDNRTVPGETQAQNKVNAEFEAKYPNITIHRVSKSFTDFEATIKLALSSPNPPDVTQINQGYGDVAIFAEAGLLRPLDDYAKAYGWASRYNPALLAQNLHPESLMPFIPPMRC